jgi:RND family efflux transporter MFP subunit
MLRVKFLQSKRIFKFVRSLKSMRSLEFTRSFKFANNGSQIAIILSLVIVLALFSGACSSSNAKEEKRQEPKTEAIRVSVFKAEIKEVSDYFEATGNLIGDAQTDVAPSVSGKVVEINFDVGSYVRKGDVMLKLDDTDARIRLQQAVAQLEQQQKAVQQAEANVETAIANLNQTKARLGLKENEENYNIEDFPQVRSIKAQLELAEKELRRAEKLLESGDISRSIYDQRKSQYDVLVSQLADARANAMVTLRAVESAKAQVKTAKAAVEQARATVAIIEKQVEQARKNLSDTIITAPISGYVAERIADLGEYVSPNSKVATIVRTAILRVRIDVPEKDIGLVTIGQMVSVQTNAYPDKTFSGKIVRIAPSVNQTSRVLTVEAEVENSKGLLKPGQFASVKITKNKSKPTVMIPTSAVRTEGDISKVFVIKDGRAEERTVKLGVLDGNLIEVQQGIKAGEMVAVSNIEQLFDGVAVVES